MMVASSASFVGCRDEEVFFRRAIPTADREWQEAVKGTELEFDCYPVVKIFYPLSDAIWLLTELDGDGIAFGLCDLELGYPELGYV